MLPSCIWQPRSRTLFHSGQHPHGSASVPPRPTPVPTSSLCSSTARLWGQLRSPPQGQSEPVEDISATQTEGFAPPILCWKTYDIFPLYDIHHRTCSLPRTGVPCSSRWSLYQGDPYHWDTAIDSHFQQSPVSLPCSIFIMVPLNSVFKAMSEMLKMSKYLIFL